ANINESTSLVASVLALSAKAIALMHMGRFGEALEILRNARGRAEKNGNSAWIFMLREGWLRVLAFDFRGAQRLCEEIIGLNARYLSGQPIAMGAIAGGYAAFYEGDHDGALPLFAGLAKPSSTPKFFLHWYWRMQAELGIAHAHLAAGNLSSARE